MHNNLPVYHNLLRQVRQWHPTERITRCRNMALVITGPFMGMTIHLSGIVSQWPVEGKNPSLSNRLRRFLANDRLDVVTWYRPLAEMLLQAYAGKQVRRQGWHFVIHQRGNVNVYQSGQGWKCINALPLAPGQTRVIGWVRVTKTHDAGWYWLLLHWQNGKCEPWFLLSDRPGERDLIKLYRVRMWLEEMFGDMKGHGFNLEDSHLRDPECISRLFLAVCISSVWFITLGT